MPKDNIERAIKKGTGELEGGRLEEGPMKATSVRNYGRGQGVDG